MTGTVISSTITNDTDELIIALDSEQELECHLFDGGVALHASKNNVELNEWHLLTWDYDTATNCSCQ